MKCIGSIVIVSVGNGSSFYTSCLPCINNRMLSTRLGISYVRSVGLTSCNGYFNK